jgi:CRP/FNR family cyclic AMP-dependent transcriptional regulator
MYLKQADLFWGLDQNFIRSLTAEATKQSFQPGDTVFYVDDSADYFYVLIQGRIKLQAGDSGKRVYVSEQIGEAFGWSALIGRETYSATCICEQPTILLRFDKHHVSRLLDQDVESAAIFFKHLAGALGERLMQLYQTMD